MEKDCRYTEFSSGPGGAGRPRWPGRGPVASAPGAI